MNNIKKIKQYDPFFFLIVFMISVLYFINSYYIIEPINTFLNEKSYLQLIISAGLSLSVLNLVFFFINKKRFKKNNLLINEYLKNSKNINKDTAELINKRINFQLNNENFKRINKYEINELVNVKKTMFLKNFLFHIKKKSYESLYIFNYLVGTLFFLICICLSILIHNDYKQEIKEAIKTIPELEEGTTYKRKIIEREVEVFEKIGQKFKSSKNSKTVINLLHQIKFIDNKAQTYFYFSNFTKDRLHFVYFYNKKDNKGIILTSK